MQSKGFCLCLDWGWTCLHAVRSYSNGPWGIHHIDRVVAHETGLVFNALDEHDYNRCNCLYKYYGKGVTQEITTVLSVVYLRGI